MSEYVGVPQQRGGFGFGRRGVVSAPEPKSDAFTLSAAAEDFIVKDRMRRQAEFEVARELSGQQTEQTNPLVNDIEFEIGGSDSQYLVVELDPGETVIAEKGSMIWKDSAVSFNTIMGDGSEKGFFSSLVSAGKNVLAGENFFLGEFRHGGTRGKAKVALGGRSTGHILPIRLEEMGGKLICQQGAFLAAAKGVAVSAELVSDFWAGLEGGEGFILQKLTGTGWAFIHVGGSLIERQLGPGERLHVDAGCIAAFEPGVKFEIADTASDNGNFISNIAREATNSAFGGEGWFFAEMTGPGKVWIQSLPFRRLSRTILDEAQANQVSTLVGGDDRNVGIGDVIDGVSDVMRLLK
jgi:uncharacterized protein (AIM24 family)